MVQSFSDGTGIERSIECLFVASACFADFWGAMRWATETGVTLDHVLLKLKLPPAPGISRLEKTGKITIGNPRSPLRDPNAQTSHLWVVDVVCPCRIVMLIHRDPVCGHT